MAMLFFGGKFAKCMLLYQTAKVTAGPTVSKGLTALYDKYVAWRYVALRCFTLRYIALRCVALRCVTLLTVSGLVEDAGAGVVAEAAHHRRCPLPITAATHHSHHHTHCLLPPHPQPPPTPQP